jgi:hypothetical protein
MIDLILLCFGTAALSLFLDKCMEEGMIFHWYYKLIERFPEWLFYPLGGCKYCMGTWVFVLFYYLPPTGYNVLGLFLGIGINFIIIRALEKYAIEG